ncbi:D-arabinono-1,4-lactone oxidase-domain-containing protein [Syncephalis fuscata]|nr:D-arabinono-1,4-lactone oxidase-domain-containing protein [Syncephalis fuscata]
MADRTAKVKYRRNFIFKNWAATHRCQPEFYFEPETEAQVTEIIRRARAQGKTCRAIGAGHSPSDLACTNEYMIGTDRLNRFLSVDVATRRVRVQAGMRLYDLHKHLEQHQLALSNLGSISDQSIAGLITSGTHGTGADYGILSTLVTELTLVTADGALVTCSPDKLPRLFRAAQCSLGCLGIIVRVELQCEPSFHLRAAEMLTTMHEVLPHWHETVRSAEHVRMWWFPHSDDTVVWRADRTVEPTGRTPAISWFRDRLVGFHLYEFGLYVSRFMPYLLTSAIERWKVAWLHRTPIVTVGPSYQVFNFDCLFSQRVNEWAVPASQAPEAIRQLKAVIQKKEFPVHFPIEIRFVAKDDIWLSPAQGHDVCYIGVIMYRPYNKPVPYKRFWKEYERIMHSLGGRPHWAKEHGLVYKDLVKLYPCLDDFLQVRQQVDPSGTFLNEYIRRHLLPSTDIVQAKL